MKNKHYGVSEMRKRISLTPFFICCIGSVLKKQTDHEALPEGMDNCQSIKRSLRSEKSKKFC